VLSGAMRAELRLRFEGCLCLACLRALQSGSDSGTA
jgi:hypothetical protein